MSFYTYRQNNSGGFWDDIAGRRHLVIEASSADEANARAESMGVYFDWTRDCGCCGSRWARQHDNDAEASLAEAVENAYSEPSEVVIVMANGVKAWPR